VESQEELAILVQLNKNHELEIIGYRSCETEAESLEMEWDVFAGKKYNPVDQKVRPIRITLSEEFRIICDIKGDPLAEIPTLNPNLPDFVSTGWYTQEQKDHMDRVHNQGFLWPEEMKVVHHLLMLQNEAFAWTDLEQGSFREDFFLPVKLFCISLGSWKTYQYLQGLKMKFVESWNLRWMQESMSHPICSIDHVGFVSSRKMGRAWGLSIVWNLWMKSP
jgi:hypothetical protein